MKSFETMYKEFREEDIKELETLILDADAHIKEWSDKLYVYKLRYEKLKEELKKMEV